MTPKKRRILVVDDSPSLLSECRAKVKKAVRGLDAAVMDCTVEDIKKALSELDVARKKARDAKGAFDVTKGPDLFNEADVVLLDYELIRVDGTTALTGEEMAYLLRCFSTAGVLVVMNAPDIGDNGFNLNLVRSMESWADVSIGVKQIDNPWLWSERKRGFAPWSWPNLLDAAGRREGQVKCVRTKPDELVLDVVGIPRPLAIGMPHQMAEAVVTRRVSDAGEIVPGFRTAHEMAIGSEHGLHPNDVEALAGDRDQVARIAASRIAHWIENVVLPDQGVLIDAPHLVSRLPELLSGSVRLSSAWQALAVRDRLKGLERELVVAHKCDTGDWVSRPVWLWPKIASDQQYAQWLGRQAVDYVFCEDESAFRKRETAHRFMAAVTPQFAARYVGTPDPAYRPSVRLSM